MRRGLVANWLDENTAKAVAVLATATMRQLGRETPVVGALQRLLRDRTQAAFHAACATFDALDAATRERIARTAPGIARRRLKPTNLPGLLGALNRR
jgi:hypothetical protein